MSRVAFGLERTTYAWDKECGLPCIVVSFAGLQMSAVPRADCREVVLSSLARAVCVVFSICFCFTGQSRTMQEYVRVRVQSPAYIGYSPADGLSDTFEGWAALCRIALVERSLTRFLPPWRS